MMCIQKRSYCITKHCSWNGMDWKQSPDGQHNLAHCRSISMDTIVGARGKEPHTATWWRVVTKVQHDEHID